MIGSFYHLDDHQKLKLNENVRIRFGGRGFEDRYDVSYLAAIRQPMLVIQIRQFIYYHNKQQLDR